MLIVQCTFYYQVHAKIGRKIIRFYLLKISGVVFFCRYGISPGGLASQSYDGVMFFDMDW